MANSALENLPHEECPIDPTFILNRELMIPPTVGGAFEAISEICSAFQYEYFLIATSPDYKGQFDLDHIMLTNLPAYLTDDLINLENCGDWTVLLEIENTLAPFCWCKKHGVIPAGTTGQLPDSSDGITAADRLFINQLQTTAIHCVQAPTRDHKRAFIAAFSSSASCKKISSEFVLAFLKLFDRIESLFSGRRSGMGENLTNRELECLRWASVGKTSAEIAVIASLSEHTVNHYLISCCKKLDCLNRTQAVAKVLRLGVIT